MILQCFPKQHYTKRNNTTQETTDLVTFTEEILNTKLYFFVQCNAMVKLKKKKQQPCGVTVKPTRQLYCKIVTPYIHSYIHISQEFLGAAIFHALYVVVSKA